MHERAEMIEWIRGEIVGPARRLSEPHAAVIKDGEFVDRDPARRGPLAWQPDPQADLEEILSYGNESPHRKYGAGLLHPGARAEAETATVQAEDFALHSADTIGADLDPNAEEPAARERKEEWGDEGDAVDDSTDDFEVTSPDVRQPSTVGVSFCAKLSEDGRVVIRLPRSRRFTWQNEGAVPFALNGRYISARRRSTDGSGKPPDGPIWCRLPAVPTGCEVVIGCAELNHATPIRRDVPMPPDSPIRLRVEIFPRRRDDAWLLTVVLRNVGNSTGGRVEHDCTLYQTYFEVLVEDGSMVRYPDSERPFEQLDAEEQSLALLYRESATWGIGHGCACGWDSGQGEVPEFIYADAMPAVQLPSMTPDIKDADGKLIELRMRDLANLPDDGSGPAWQSLDSLASEYERWIQRRRQDIVEMAGKDRRLVPTANRHLDACEKSLRRVRAGIGLLRNDYRVRHAFRLANLAMMLQQIAGKQLRKRPLKSSSEGGWTRPEGPLCSPWKIYTEAGENDGLGIWRAFQVAFLLMSLDGVCNGSSPDREVVDLVWFPTGGGKTEAYLAVMSVYMFHERLLMKEDGCGPRRDGTNVLMRYTLRMLTAQQFQRAASLICAMEFLRRQPEKHAIVPAIPGDRFSLGLWIGGDGSPNKVKEAEGRVKDYRMGVGGKSAAGNPLVISECPWCRAQIGRIEDEGRRSTEKSKGAERRVMGIGDVEGEGPLLLCTDADCDFGKEHHEQWLPIEVIDERIYRHPPSLVIGTVDKFAMVAYRPDAGVIFGTRFDDGKKVRFARPPGLIIQDELHLISGPLGTVCALYEGVFERLCSVQGDDGQWLKPKIVASTATIRGAAEQVKSIYARAETNLFPPPGLSMGDTFFGAYARDSGGRLGEGRLYLGIHANGYGSVITTQVRVFSAALFRPSHFPEDLRDPWWTLLVFYNSLRELGGAKTIFDSDVRSRLKFMFNREGIADEARRHLRVVEELTGRLQQSEIVKMMERLSTPVDSGDGSAAIDACLASNIIEVGVDIDRLSLMGVVGQPKTTATYIQVTGRVGRRWWDRPGLVLTIYNPAKSRDRSHFEQFHSYHRRLYERVEPTTATPFATSAVQRALVGALIAYARQQSREEVWNTGAYEAAVKEACSFLQERCREVQAGEDTQRSLDEMERMCGELLEKWRKKPEKWEEFPPAPNGNYLMLWPGQYAGYKQLARGVVVPSSMRQVDASAELRICPLYVAARSTPTPAKGAE
ncbi:MAG: helicase-related protein [Acidobacteriaceae bacterium]